MGGLEENIGTIEVVVLRCHYHHTHRDTAEKRPKSDEHSISKSQRATKKAPSTTSTIPDIFGGLLDGVSDSLHMDDGLASIWIDTRSTINLAVLTHDPGMFEVECCHDLPSVGLDGYESDDHNFQRHDGYSHGNRLSSDRIRPGCSFAEYKNAQRQNCGSFDSQQEQVYGATNRAREKGRFRKQDLEAQCVQTVNSIFWEIENDMLSQIRIRNDKINFLVNAMKDARENAPDLLNGLDKRHAQFVRENERQAEEIERLLGTAIGYMAALDDEDWAACRDIIIDKGWLDASHPWLSDTDRPGIGNIKTRHGSVGSARRVENDHCSKQGGVTSRTGLLNQTVNDWHEISSHVHMTAPDEPTGGAEKPDRQVSEHYDQDHHWSRHSAARSTHSTSKVSQPWGFEAQTDEQFLRGDGATHDEPHWRDEKNSPWQTEGVRTKNPSTLQGWPKDNGDKQVSSDTKRDHQSPLALDTGADGTTRSVVPSQASKRCQKSRTALSLSEPRRTVKPYWADAMLNHTTSRDGKEHGKTRDPYTFPAEPRPTLPKNSNKGLSVGVQAGRGVEYVHRIGAPEYIDSLHDPYAVFTFKYRTPAELEKTLGRRFRDKYREETEKAQKEELYGMPKDKLVEELLQARRKTVSANSQGKVEATWASHHSDVKPADSVSQAKSVRNDAGWGTFHSKAPTDNGWAPDDRRVWSEPKDNGANGWSEQPSNTGWAPEQKSRASKSSATVQHFSDSKLRTTGKPENTGWIHPAKSSSRIGALGFTPDTGNNANANADVDW